jgi:hypothetical protein
MERGTKIPLAFSARSRTGAAKLSGKFRPPVAGREAAVRERLHQLPAERLATLGRALLRAQSLRELGLEE